MSISMGCSEFCQTPLTSKFRLDSRFKRIFVWSFLCFTNFSQLLNEYAMNVTQLPSSCAMDVTAMGPSFGIHNPRANQKICVIKCRWPTSHNLRITERSQDMQIGTTSRSWA